jgi:hypothetical protein
VKIKAGGDHSAVSCVIYFAVWFLNVYRGGEGECTEKVHGSYFYNSLNAKRLTCMKVERFLKLALNLDFGF